MALVVTSAKAPAKNDPPARASNCEVRLRVRILDTKSGQPLKDGGGVAVWLVPTDNLQKASFDPQPVHYQMTQRNKMFEPHLLVVPAGGVVEFGNRDPWFHDAFSISRAGRFDLGLSQGGTRKSIRFDRAGASYVFCRIHPQMAAVVLAVDSSYFGLSDHAGHITIGKVPPGKYILRVWYEDATQKELAALQSPVTITEEKHQLPTISVAVTKQPILRRPE